jgi:hypothetical protein
VRQHLKQSIFSSRPAPFSTRAAVKFGQEERKQAKHARNLVLKLRTRDLNTKRPSGRAALSFHCARLKWKNAADTYIDGEKETFACSPSIAAFAAEGCWSGSPTFSFSLCSIYFAAAAADVRKQRRISSCCVLSLSSFYFISSSLSLSLAGWLAGEKFRLERRNARATALNGTR